MTKRRGMALVAVMWIVLLGAMLLLGAQRDAHVQYAAAHNELAAVQARWLARAGVEQAMAVLQDDFADADSAEDFWFDDPYSFDAIALADGYTFTVYTPLENAPQPGVIRFGLIDLASRINVNNADADQLESLGILTDVQVQSILDWRDGDDRQRVAGAEQAHYDKLDLPYDMANAPFQTAAELRLVRDVDDETFRGEDANLNGMLDGNENDGENTWPDDDADGQLKPGLMHLVTPYTYERNLTGLGAERVDMNKADQKTLEDELNFTAALAKGVVDKRGRGEFDSLMDLLQVQPSGQSQPGDDEKIAAINLDWLARNMDNLTLHEEEILHGRVNVNTAPRDLLMTLPQIDVEAAEAIVNARDGEQGTFLRVGDLHLSGVLTEDQFKAVAERVTVRGNAFEVTSVGRTPSGVSCTVTAVIDRGASPMRIAYWYEHE